MALLSAISWMFMPVVGLPDNAYEAGAVTLLAYLLGHMLFALSQRWVAWLASKLSGNPKSGWLEADATAKRVDPKEALDTDPNANRVAPGEEFPRGLGEQLRNEIIKRAGEKWCLAADCIVDKHVIYELCRNYIHVRDNERSSFLRKEQTYGELSRSMVIVFLLCACLVWVSAKPLDVIILTFFICLVGVVLFYARYLKAREADACLVYTNFIVLLKEEKELASEFRRKGNVKVA